MSESEQAIELRPAWRTYWQGLLFTLAALLASVILYFQDDVGPPWFADMGASVLAIVGLVVGIYTVAKRYSWKFTVEGERLFRHEGLIARNQQSIRLRDLRSVELDQSLLQRLFRVGDLAFYSAGSAEAEVRFTGIYDPVAVRDAIYRRVDSHRVTPGSDA